MEDHRLDYGSVKIMWLSLQSDAARISAACVCGLVLSGEGKDYTEAYRRLQQAIADHVFHERFKPQDLLARRQSNSTAHLLQRKAARAAGNPRRQ